MSRRNSNYDASQINATGLKSNYGGSLNDRRVSSQPIVACSRGVAKSTNRMSDRYSTPVVSGGGATRRTLFEHEHML